MRLVRLPGSILGGTLVCHGLFSWSGTFTFSCDPAASPGRMEAILRELEREYDFIEPQAVSEDDLGCVHTQAHIESIKRDKHLYDISCLAAGYIVEMFIP